MVARIKEGREGDYTKGVPIVDKLDHSIKWIHISVRETIAKLKWDEWQNLLVHTSSTLKGK